MQNKAFIAFWLEEKGADIKIEIGSPWHLS